MKQHLSRAHRVSQCLSRFRLTWFANLCRFKINVSVVCTHNARIFATKQSQLVYSSQANSLAGVCNKSWMHSFASQAHPGNFITETTLSLIKSMRMQLQTSAKWNQTLQRDSMPARDKRNWISCRPDCAKLPGCVSVKWNNYLTKERTESDTRRTGADVKRQ